MDLEVNSFALSDYSPKRAAERSIPTSLYSHFFEALRNLSNIGGATRNLMKGVATCIGPAAVMRVSAAFGGLYLAGGLMGVLNGADIFRRGVEKLPHHYQTANLEQASDRTLFAAFGLSYTTMHVLMVCTQVASYAFNTAIATTSAAIISYLGFPMFAFLSAWAGYGVAIHKDFISQLEAKEKEGLTATLAWIKEKLEATSIIEAEKKSDQFSFRTSEEVCQLVRENVSRLIQELEIPNLTKEATAEAEKMLKEVKRANSKNLLNYYLILTIAAIGLTAFSVALVFATGPAAPLVFFALAVVSSLYIGVDSTWVREKIGDAFYGKSEVESLKRKAMEQPPPSLLAQAE